jgi:diguanylate cyclase (GGDEF)-like protein/PAS domain S-box-containing protein
MISKTIIGRHEKMVYRIKKENVNVKNFLEIVGHDLQAFKSIFDNIKDLIFLMEEDHHSFRYIYVNHSALHILNLDETIIGRRMEDVLPKDRADILIKKYNLVIYTQKTIEFTEHFKTEKGTFFGETSLSPILTKDGTCKYVLAIVRDISKRKQDEQQLKENQKKLQSLIEHNGDAVYELDLNGHFRSINHRATEITGYDKEDLIGKPFVPFIREHDGEKTLTHFQRALQGRYEEYEAEIYHKDGNPIQLFIKNIPIVIDGGLKGVFGIAKDITTQKEMEKILRENEEKYRLISENAFDIIRVISPSGYVKYVSPSIQKILGYSVEEYVGKSYLKYVHPEDVSILRKRLTDIMNGEKTPVVEIRVLHKKGFYLWLEITTTPVLENGEVRELVTIARDITDRKKLLEKLKKAAFYDSLSKLPNRRVFHKQLQAAINEAALNNKKVAVMMVDGWKFKQINDTYGHVTGDAVIVEMGKRIRANVRKQDTVARIGGDEIAILLPNIESQQIAEEIAKRIIQSFTSPFFFNGTCIHMGISIGMALYPDHTLDMNTLIKYADKALYEAKEIGKNEYKIYSATE